MAIADVTQPMDTRTYIFLLIFFLKCFRELGLLLLVREEKKDTYISCLTDPQKKIPDHGYDLK